MSDRVTCTVADGVADVRLNRPDKLNALDSAMFAALRDTGESLKAAAGVRAVVLSGEGRGFCAGLDRDSFEVMLAGNYDSSFDRPVERLANDVQQSAWVWTELKVPVIAAVHGVALGGGLQIALGADIRIVAPDARLSFLEVQWGIVPDMAGTYLLPRLVGPDRAKELIWSCRWVDGAEAAQIGLATRTSADPLAEALSLARTLAQSSPDSIRASKKLLDDAATATPEDQFRAEELAVRRLIGAPNQVEAVNARLGKRPPKFVEVEDD